MSGSTKKRLIILVSLITIGLLLVILWLSQTQSTPLTKIETQLAGRWLNVEGQEEDPGFGITLDLDRKFRSNSGQFFGRWKVESGKLTIEYTSERNWGGDSWSEKIRNGMKSQPSYGHHFTFRLTDDGSRLELTELTEMEVTSFVRVPD